MEIARAAWARASKAEAVEVGAETVATVAMVADTEVPKVVEERAAVREAARLAVVAAPQACLLGTAVAWWAAAAQGVVQREEVPLVSVAMVVAVWAVVEREAAAVETAC